RHYARNDEPDRQNAPRCDHERDREAQDGYIDAHWIVSATHHEHQRDRDRGEKQLHEHMRGEDGPRTERRRTQTLETPAFAIDRDDRHERQHRVDRDQHRNDDRNLHAEELTLRHARRRHHAASESAEHQVDEHGHHDRAERPERLAHEYLYLDPR